MTTTVTIKAAHWDVAVTAVSTKTGERSPAPTVSKGETRDFYVHSDMDLLIHEIQPGEATAPTPDRSASRSRRLAADEERGVLLPIIE